MHDMEICQISIWIIGSSDLRLLFSFNTELRSCHPSSPSKHPPHPCFLPVLLCTSPASSSDAFSFDVTFSIRKQATQKLIDLETYSYPTSIRRGTLRQGSTLHTHHLSFLEFRSVSVHQRRSLTFLWPLPLHPTSVSTS